MVFKKRNKIILPPLTEKSNSDTEDLEADQLRSHTFKDEIVNADEEIGEVDNLEMLPLKVHRKAYGITNNFGSRQDSRRLKHSSTVTGTNLSLKPVQQNHRKGTIKNVPSSKEESVVSDSESSDEYSSLYSKQTTLKPKPGLSTDNESKLNLNNGKGSRILNLEDEEELQMLDSDEEMVGSVTGNTDDYSLQSLKFQIKTRSSKLRQLQSEPRPFHSAEERKYVRMLSQEDRDDILEMINKNGGLKRQNEREPVDIVDVDSEFADERLALTEKEKEIQRQVRRRHIVDALESSSIGGPGGGDERAEMEWERKVLKKSGRVLSNIKVPTTSFPTLSRTIAKDTDPDIYLRMEQTKLRLEKRKKDLQLKALRGHVGELTSKKKILLERLFQLIS